MPTNNLSLTVGPGSEEGEEQEGEKDWHEEKEAESMRRKCPAEGGGAHQIWMIKKMGGKNEELNSTEKDQDPVENEVSSRSFRDITLQRFP